MTLFDAFSKTAPNRIFLSIILGVLSGISYTFLIPILVSAIKPVNIDALETLSNTYKIAGIEISNIKYAVLFFSLCLFILISRTISQVILSRISLDLTANMRMALYERILKAPINTLERVGSAKLIATLTSDIGRVVSASRIIPDILINAITVIGMLGFLMYLNTSVFWLSLKTIFFGVLSYQLLILASKKFYVKARAEIDILHNSIQGLIFGAKELKLSQKKSDSYFANELTQQEKSFLKHEKTGVTIIRVAVNYGDMVSLFVIGVLAFIYINYVSINPYELVGIIMALLYTTGPLSVVINGLPEIAVGRISLNKINSVLQELDEELINHEVRPVSSWNKISFDQVTYTHAPEKTGDSFTLGPINLEINRGEVTFIVGGNGSGKSTLSKLLTLHNAPTEGRIKFDDVIINTDTIKSYRQIISSIYSDYFLFNRLLETGQQDIEHEFNYYLAKLKLDGKVTITNGHFSSLSLSDGQRRRMALLVAYIEDKDIYLFDEWAADQDPAFKEYFYNDVLNELREKNKAVIVISHDDRYFHVADKVITMENGKIASSICNKKMSELQREATHI